MQIALREPVSLNSDRIASKNQINVITYLKIILNLNYQIVDHRFVLATPTCNRNTKKKGGLRSIHATRWRVGGEEAVGFFWPPINNLILYPQFPIGPLSKPSPIKEKYRIAKEYEGSFAFLPRHSAAIFEPFPNSLSPQLTPFSGHLVQSFSLHK
ncbi:unnamed protein product [Lactuca virosa]|uniref:Uncharacterized protein n=1 Tax=Lactuca virosa TaxID=75947 RepID=A0AAU9LP34_9ASTR|nr:unnamed protein product [Lactuca virosa]